MSEAIDESKQKPKPLAVGDKVYYQPDPESPRWTIRKIYADMATIVCDDGATGFVMLDNLKREPDKKEPDAEFWVSRDIECAMQRPVVFYWSAQPILGGSGVWTYCKPAPEVFSYRINKDVTEALGLLPEPGQCLHVRRFGNVFSVQIVENK